jgi:hypothetical protein
MLVLSIPVAKIVILKGNRKIAMPKTGTESSAGQLIYRFDIASTIPALNCVRLFTYLYPDPTN